MRKKELEIGEKEKCLYDKKNQEKVYSYLKKHRSARIKDIVEDCAVNLNISPEEVWYIVQSILKMKEAKRDEQILAKASKDKEVLGMVANGKITVVDFFATWCGPCEMLGEELKKIKDKDVVVKRVDIDSDNGLSERLGINAVPFVAIFDKSGKPFTAFTGYRDENNLKKIIENAREVK